MTPSPPIQFPPVPAVVLAAGRSLRMGQAKGGLPHPASGLPFVRHVTNTLRDAGAAPVAVVTGPHHGALVAALAGAPVACLFNPCHDEGQLASLQRALAWGRGITHAEWLLVTLVDVPDVATATVATLVAAARTTAALAVRPCHRGRHGHPVLWHREAWPRLEVADLTLGARDVMRALAAQGRVADVDVDDPGVLRDVDTPTDYQQFRREHDAAHRTSQPGPSASVVVSGTSTVG